MWLIMSLVGALIDSVFITSFFKAKYNVKRYFLLIFNLSLIMLISFFIPQSIVSKIILVVVLCFFSCFWCNTNKAQYFIIPIFLIGLISAIVRLNIQDDFLMWLIIITTEIVSIIAINEDINFKIKFNITTITFKILALIIFLSVILLSKSYYIMR